MKTEDGNSFVSCELSPCVCRQPVCPRAVWSTVSAAATDRAAALAVPGGGWRPWRRQRRQCPVSTQYLHYIYTIYRGSALSTESPLSHCRGRDNAPAETRRGRPGAAAPRRNTETLIIFRLIMNTRQKCADWRRGIKKRRYFISSHFSKIRLHSSSFMLSLKYS